MKNCLRIFALALFATPVLAAPPLVTEDAGTLAPGACQLEIEQRNFRRSTERDVLPACNLLFNSEMQLGFLHARPDDSPTEKRWLFQVKKTLWESEPEGLALGIALGTIRLKGSAERAAERDNFVTVPLTGTVDKTTWSVNAGGTRNSAEGKWKRFLAAAIEHDLNDRVTLVGEVFGTKGEPTAAQIGGRYWIVNKKVQLTASIGQERNGGRDGRWTSFGIRFEME
ncbi:MAG: hypothetical protein JNM76_15810 [Betaproteobacteria bacterium]|nr:hypothetical protein [Betaproteobacteria bacterium]